MIQSPAQKVSRQATHKWIIERVEDGERGIEIFIEGAEFPMKGYPLPQTVADVNVMKKVLGQSLKIMSFPQLWPTLLLFVILPKKKFLNQLAESVNEVSRFTIGPQRLKPKSLCPFAKELHYLLINVFMDIGLTMMNADNLAGIISQIFDTDAAYRWRIQDLLTETTALNLTEQKELKRLSKMAILRGGPRVGRELARGILFFRALLLWPSFRKSIKRELEYRGLKKLQFDESDAYWTSFWGDYKFFGMDIKQREKLVKDMGWKIPITHEI